MVLAMKSIVVVGAGPAGVVCALGLHRLGLNVVVVNTPRKFSAVEGTTQRVLNSFQQLGLTKALATINPSYS